jgi:formylglycine-generating enzyme required for sulfatase activity
MAKSNKQASKDNRPKKKQVEKSGKSEDNKINPQVTVAIIGGIVTVVIALFSFPPFVRLFEPTETPTASIISTQVIPMESSATSADIPTPTSTSLPPLIVDKVSKEMVLIPAGDFIMGSDTGDPNESPSHVVHLDTFYIDRTEVTNTEYRACVQEKMCQPPLSLSSRTRQKYYGDKRFDNYPVVNVDWGMAKAYCEWRGARLPTEAEWEKAARGENGFTYPWGDAFSCSKGNFDDEQKIDDYFVPGGPDCDGFPDTAPVGSYPAGASPYGVLDMSGNVWEWVNSMANPYPYNENDGRESPGSSSMRSIKGGAFTANDYYSRSSNRRQDSPVASNDNTGIRCARSVEP